MSLRKIFTAVLAALIIPFSMNVDAAKTHKKQAHKSAKKHSAKRSSRKKTASYKEAAKKAKDETTTSTAATATASTATGNNNQHVSGEAIITTAMQYVGVPYRRGTSSPHSFDCSGFTSYVFKNHGIDLLRASRSQFTQGQSVSRSDLQVGDLVFFRGRSGRGGVGHVGIVTEVNKDQNSFKFIHARSKGVGVDDSKMAYYSARYVGARRILTGSK